jgi:hypothetical protein
VRAPPARYPIPPPPLKEALAFLRVDKKNFVRLHSAVAVVKAVQPPGRSTDHKKAVPGGVLALLPSAKEQLSEFAEGLAQCDAEILEGRGGTFHVLLQSKHQLTTARCMVHVTNLTPGGVSDNPSPWRRILRSSARSWAGRRSSSPAGSA